MSEVLQFSIKICISKTCFIWLLTCHGYHTLDITSCDQASQCTLQNIEIIIIIVVVQ